MKNCGTGTAGRKLSIVRGMTSGPEATLVLRPRRHPKFKPPRSIPRQTALRGPGEQSLRTPDLCLGELPWFGKRLNRLPTPPGVPAISEASQRGTSADASSRPRSIQHPGGMPAMSPSQACFPFDSALRPLRGRGISAARRGVCDASLMALTLNGVEAGRLIPFPQTLMGCKFPGNFSACAQRAGPIAARTLARFAAASGCFGSRARALTRSGSASAKRPCLARRTPRLWTGRASAGARVAARL